MLFEKFCELMNALQRGTHQEFEKARSEMSALCVEADSKLSGLTQRALDLPYAPACVVCRKPVDLQGHIVFADDKNKLIATAAYCAEHWAQLCAIESASQ